MVKLSSWGFSNANNKLFHKLPNSILFCLRLHRRYVHECTPLRTFRWLHKPIFSSRNKELKILNMNCQHPVYKSAFTLQNSGESSICKAWLTRKETMIILTATAETQAHLKGPWESLWSYFHRALCKTWARKTICMQTFLANIILFRHVIWYQLSLPYRWVDRLKNPAINELRQSQICSFKLFHSDTR